MNPDQLPGRPRLSPFRTAGGLVFVSGQLGFDRQAAIPAGFGAQASQVLDNVRAVLGSAGCRLADVVQATVYLTNPDDFAAFNALWGDAFESPYPARTTVVSRLVVAGALIEIDVVAVAPA
jgi:2-iminobutanoate/2-iminopropanoate deaminase